MSSAIDSFTVCKQFYERPFLPNPSQTSLCFICVVETFDRVLQVRTMNTVDFLEAPKANTGQGDQDTFEMFARDFLEAQGFRIVQGPGRGADGGRDLIVEELRVGVGGETLVRWLVSCKHYAHSGKSVGVEDETNIMDRLKASKATGFLAFYSTIPSSGLVTRLQELAPTCESTVFDRAKIEASLLKSESGHRLFSRYFPVSYRTWTGAHPSKPQLLFKEEPLTCVYCNKDLLNEENVGLSMLVMLQSMSTKQIDDVYWCCKGHCDDMLRSKRQNHSHIDLWDEMSDYIVPTFYILAVVNHLNAINRGDRFSPEALKAFRRFLIATFHRVSRTLTPREKELVKMNIEYGIL